MAAATDRQGPPPREAFARFVALATRWSDNDAYGHLNNVVYYALFDSAVNAILIEAGLLDPATSPIIGLVVESNCRFYASLTYPEPTEVGVAVEHLGRVLLGKPFERHQQEGLPGPRRNLRQVLFRQQSRLRSVGFIVDGNRAPDFGE